MAIAGKVAITPKGEWSSTKSYEKLDAVSYNNRLFIAKKASAGIVPEDGDIWMLAVASVDTEKIENIINGTTVVGAAASANKVWTQSHNGTWYINSNFDGTYFQTNCTESGGQMLPIKVGASESADSANSATKAEQDGDGNEITDKYVNIYSSNDVNADKGSTTVNDLACDGSAVGMIYGETDNPFGEAGWIHVWSQAYSKGNNDGWVSQIALGVNKSKGMWYRTAMDNIVGKKWLRCLDESDEANLNVNSAVKDGNGNVIAGTYMKNLPGAFIVGQVGDYTGGIFNKNDYKGVYVSHSANVSDGGFLMTDDNYFGLGTAVRRWKEIYGVNSAISTSDRNEKYNISYIGEESEFDTETSDGLLTSLIMGMNPVVFKRTNGESGRPHHGMISQDFEELLNTLGIDHAGFIKSPVTKQVEVYEVDGVEVLRKDLEGEFTEEIPEEILEEYGETVTKSIEYEVIEGKYKYGLRYEEFIGDIIRFCQILKNENDELRQEIQAIKADIASLKNV